MMTPMLHALATLVLWLKSSSRVWSFSSCFSAIQNMIILMSDRQNYIESIFKSSTNILYPQLNYFTHCTTLLSIPLINSIIFEEFIYSYFIYLKLIQRLFKNESNSSSIGRWLSTPLDKHLCYFLLVW